MAKNRTEIWLALLVIAIALALAGFGGLWVYMSATPPLHPDPQAVPSTVSADPLAKWSGAVEEGRQIARAALADHSLPGLSVAVGVEDDLVWAEGFGWADLNERVPVAADMKFRIGSASPALTSAAVGVLVQQGKLTLDEKIDTYVPRFAGQRWPITLRQVMAHVAGIVDDSGDEGPLLSEQCERPIDALQYLGGNEAQLLFEPGTQYRQSNYGWILVSAAIEAAAGEPFAAFMQKEIFEPLGMNDTRAESATAPIPNRVTQYFPRFAADPRYGQHVMRPVDYSCYAGASAFLSTPSDLVRFGMAINGVKLLQPATVEALQTTQRLASGEETGYGLGWNPETVTLAGEQTRAVGQDGELLGGKVATLMTFPAHGIVVAVTSNISYADTSAIAARIADVFAEQKRVQAAR